MSLEDRICRYARRLVELELMASASGNLSVRVDGRVLMTPTSCMKDELTPEDLVEVDMAGHRLRGDRPISTEGRMHLAIYQQRPDVHAVVHAHPITVTALGIAEDAPQLAITGEGADFVGEVGLVEWFIPGTEALASAVGRVSSHSDSIILRHHGAVTCGATLEDAFARMQAFEHVAKIYLRAQQLGRVREIDPRDVARMRSATQRKRG